MRFWGWGDEAPDGAQLGSRAEAMLARELDLASDGGGVGRRVRRIEDVAVEPSGLPDDARAALEAVCAVRDDHEARVLHAAGKAYPDLIRLRSGDATGAPDAVVLPESHAEVRAVLEACARRGVAVVPFGGGTSVVGGVEPLRGPHRAVVSLDLSRLARAAVVDERSRTASVEAGTRLPALDAQLAGLGLTLGHLPQSYEYATVGGCVATRSAGQASTGYGRIDDLVLGVRLAAPAGDLDLPALPASAAGPDLRELVVGSEGTLGVITRVTLQLAARPGVAYDEGVVFRSFADGIDALRELAQAGASPDIARLSDEEETRVQLALAGDDAKATLADAYLRLRRVAGGAMAILGWEGELEDVRRRRRRAAALLRAHGAVRLGTSPGRAWRRGRFSGPYLRDELLDRGLLVETLETAATWSGLLSLYRAVADALRSALGRAIVMCHVSHVYPSGASLYFTVLAAARPGEELAQWRAAKAAASEAIVASGGTITHHHAVGRDHAPYLRAEAGELGLAALRAAKAELDPAGIMNPGKLLPD